MKYSPLILFLSFVITSCGVKTDLDEEDLKWLVYEPGDTLIFQSETGVLDTTIIISKKIFYPDYNPIEIHGKYLPEIGQIWYYNKNTPYINDGKELVFLEKKEPDKKADGFISYLNETFFFDSDYFKKVDKTISTHNKTFSDLIEITSSRKISLKCQTIKRIWWSVSQGIIKYETCDGIIWTKI